MILFDTNVISELVKPRPNAAVGAFIAGLSPDTVFTAAICEAEIRYGLARTPPGKKRDTLTARIMLLFATGFPDRILPFDRACAAAYGEIRHARDASGQPITVQDAMIAATARAYGVQAIATRNTRDFAHCGVALIDPWQAR